jgi:nitroreductase
MTYYDREEQNRVLDHIIESRHTIRKFKDEAPPKEMIEKILRAGMLAPYTQIVTTREDFRRFVVIPKESEATAKAAALLRKRATALYGELKDKMQRDDFYKNNGLKYLGRLESVGPKGMPLLGNAPYYIVVADQKVVLDKSGLALAHCLQNMWLKATALGLGFQLLTLTEEMTDSREFSELIGIPFGEYVLDGCLVGYPDAPPVPSKRPPLDEMTRWI